MIIVFLASPLSFQGGINVPGYTAAKSGIAGLTRALANEWAGSGVNVNAIVPGYVVTDNTTALREDPARDASILGRIPAGRWAERCAPPSDPRPPPAGGPVRARPAARSALCSPEYLS